MTNNQTVIYVLSNGQKVIIEDPDPVAAPLPAGTIVLARGLHTLLDPYFMENPGFNRIVHQPERTRAAPLLTGGTGSSFFRVADFSSTVQLDSATGQFRMWYVGRDSLTGFVLNAWTTSWDGITWSPPHFVPEMGNNYLGIVLDEGPGFAVPAERYKAVLRETTQPIPNWPGDLWMSPDNLVWNKGPNVVPTAYGECWSLFHMGPGYGLVHRWNLPSSYTWMDMGGVQHIGTKHEGWVRCLALTASPNGLSYPPSTLLFKPSASYPGETQFYYASNVLRLGEIYLAVVGLLRDDVVVSGVSPAGAYGTGYSTLAWSRDGVTWNIYDGYDPHFFDPSPNAADWDHAMTWITSLVPVGDEVYLYYGGYQWGHKVGTDRQIGMVKIKRDRWVSRHAGATAVLRTKLINFDATSLSVNVTGLVRIQITDQNNVPIPGFSFSDGLPINGDYIETSWSHSGDLASLKDRAVHLEFELTNADLYAFYLK